MDGRGPAAPGTVTLGPHPASPGAARRHVADLLEDGPLADLLDTASLLVSEVVTNAVLHAATDIELSCSVDHGTLCVEVRDGSTLAPSQRHYDATAMTGRGLGMVELLADEWGVDADDGGKTVWFLLAGRDAVPAEPRAAPVEPAPRPGEFDAHLLNLPVELVTATIEYGDALLRELVLLSIAFRDDTGQENARPASRIDLGPLLTNVEEAHQAGKSSLDLVLAFSADAGEAALERLALVDEADRMAAAGELLTPAAVPEIGACRRWLFSQISLQAEGAPPTPWIMPERLEPTVGPAPMSAEEVRRLDALSTGVVVADDANRILYVNRAAAAFLGWDPDELTGQRLIAIVPPELRAAHLAGFTRYLLTGKASILGRPTTLPALRRDGSTAQVELTIEMVELGEDRRGFRATLEVAGVDVTAPPGLRSD